MEEIVTVVGRNMLDFCDLIGFFADGLSQINPTVTISTSTDEDQPTKPKHTF